MIVDCHTACRVVGEQALPAAELAQLWRRAAVERERELGASGDAPSGYGHTECPQRSATASRKRVAGARPGELLERGAR